MIRRTYRPYGSPGALLPPAGTVRLWFDRLTMQEEPPVKRVGPLWEGRNGKETS